MREYLELCSVPTDEPCAMVGADDYAKRARIECHAFIDQLERAFPHAVDAGCTFRIRSNPHDFGTYYEVAVFYDDDDEEQTRAVYDIENDLPTTWDEDARNYLAAHGYETVPRSEFWSLTPWTEYAR